ncbi:MAG: hypothetical protein ACRD4Y_10990, partial [Candidatus Acidiferrales bacterium]
MNSKGQEVMPWTPVGGTSGASHVAGTFTDPREYGSLGSFWPNRAKFHGRRTQGRRGYLYSGRWVQMIYVLLDVTC